jgi:prepilin-type processing-associated H-X9-DG protein
MYYGDLIAVSDSSAQYNSYGLFAPDGSNNTSFIFRSGPFQFWVTTYLDTAHTQWVNIALQKLGRLPTPTSETVMLADTTADPGSYKANPVSAFRNRGNGPYQNAYVHTLHGSSPGGAANVAFYDGHAVTMTAKALRYDLTSDCYINTTMNRDGQWTKYP